MLALLWWGECGTRFKATYSSRCLDCYEAMKRPLDDRCSFTPLMNKVESDLINT